ncbi:MAG: DUF4388 domain-containing protein [Anaerolineae bacterium]|nr:DUF4388 domain-containing protein [Anaerolineae bacterium]
MPRQLRGTLQDLHTTQLLHLINLAKKTGTLHVYEGVKTGREIIMGDGETKRPEVVPGKERVKVAFREGKLIHAVSAERDGHLATVLHKSGKLNDEQHRIIRQKAAQASDKALALLLINANYVSQQDIITSVRRFTLDIMYDVATWEKEPFLFEEAELPPVDRITVPIDLEPVIYDLSQKRVDADRLSKELPNLDFALKFPEAPSEKFKGIQLSVEEWRVVSFINPKNSIRQIAKACNMTDMEIRRVVIGLLNAGLVELVRPAMAEPARAGSGMRKPMGVTKDQRPMIEKLINRIKSV